MIYIHHHDIKYYHSNSSHLFFDRSAETTLKVDLVFFQSFFFILSEYIKWLQKYHSFQGREQKNALHFYPLNMLSRIFYQIDVGLEQTLVSLLRLLLLLFIVILSSFVFDRYLSKKECQQACSIKSSKLFRFVSLIQITGNFAHPLFFFPLLTSDTFFSSFAFILTLLSFEISFFD